jgi:hypothetical protein
LQLSQHTSSRMPVHATGMYVLARPIDSCIHGIGFQKERSSQGSSRKTSVSVYM